jgi:hypothetical protein
MRDTLDGIVVGSKSVDLFIDTFFANVFSGLNESDTSEFRRVNITGAVGKVRIISSSVRNTLNGIVVGSESVDFLIDTFFTNIFSGFLKKGCITRCKK